MTPPKKRPRRLNARQKEFAALVASGSSKAAAYRKVYDHPKAKPQFMAEQGSKLAARELVAAEIERIRGRSEVKKLLTLNDRLALLAEFAVVKGKTPAYINAKTRALDVYSKLAGDQAPQRIELTGKDGAPIPVAAGVTVARMSVRQRIAAMKAAREQRAEVSP